MGLGYAKAKHKKEAELQRKKDYWNKRNPVSLPVKRLSRSGKSIVTLTLKENRERNLIDDGFKLKRDKQKFELLSHSDRNGELITIESILKKDKISFTINQLHNLKWNVTQEYRRRYNSKPKRDKYKKGFNYFFPLVFIPVIKAIAKDYFNTVQSKHEQYLKYKNKAILKDKSIAGETVLSS